jgi:LacI family transcriptional regulator
MKRKATTSDIARMLGLSRTTVSKALNGHPTVPPATRQRVLDMAAQLHYKHYRPASPADLEDRNGTAGAAMRTIACLVRSSLARSGSKGYWVELLQGIEESTRRRGWNMVLHFVPPEDLESPSLPRSLTEAHVDGVIMAGINRLAYVRAVAELGLPAVLIDHDSAARAEDALFDTVLMESEQSVCDLTARLIALGHRRIGFIGDIEDCLSFKERWNGFRRAMMDAGLAVDPACCAVAPRPRHYFDGAEVAGALAAMPQLPTAFVCANDVVAIRTVQALGRIGLAVPRDLSVTGFDSIETDTDPLPDGLSLATVRIDAVRVGSRAFEQLSLRMEQPDRPTEHIRLATVPVAGASAGPPRE